MTDVRCVRLVCQALFGRLDEEAEADVDIPSHQQLDFNDDGEPKLLRFVYVDEPSCIGCTFCADVARSTFYMNDDAGRARVFHQGGDDPEIIQEAIDTCPVNCISYVDLEDLVILETEREGMTINPASIGIPATWSVSMNSLPPTRAKIFNGNGGALTCCNNCPSKGCKECPMYGVGLNPIYIERLEARQARKEASGEAAKERFDATNKQNLDAFFGGDTVPPASFDAEEQNGVVVPTGGANGGAPPDGLGIAEPSDAIFNAIYAAPFGLGDDDDELMPAPIGLGGVDPVLAMSETKEQKEAREAEEAARKAAEEREKAEAAAAEAAAVAAEEERMKAEERAAREAEAAAKEAEAAALRQALREAAEKDLANLVAASPVDAWEPTEANLRKFRFGAKKAREDTLGAMDKAIQALDGAKSQAQSAGVRGALIRSAEAKLKALRSDRKGFDGL